MSDTYTISKEVLNTIFKEVVSETALLEKKILNILAQYY